MEENNLVVKKILAELIGDDPQDLETEFFCVVDKHNYAYHLGLDEDDKANLFKTATEMIMNHPKLVNAVTPIRFILEQNSEMVNRIYADENKKKKTKRIVRIKEYQIAINKKKRTLLEYIIQNRDLYDFIMKNGCDVNYQVNNRNILVYCMTTNLDSWCFNAIVEHPHIDKNNFEPMRIAIQNYHTYYLEKMVEYDFNLHQINSNGYNLFKYVIDEKNAKILLDIGIIPTEKEIFYIAMMEMENKIKFSILKLIFPVFLKNYSDSSKILKLYDINNIKFTIKPEICLLYKKLVMENCKGWRSREHIRRIHSHDKTDDEIWKEYNCMDGLNTYAKNIRPSLKQITVHNIIKNSHLHSKEILEKISSDILEMFLDAKPMLDQIETFYDNYGGAVTEIQKERDNYFTDEDKLKCQARKVFFSNIEEIMENRLKIK